MSNAFEYGDALLPQPELGSEPVTGERSNDENGETSPRSPIESNQPYLNLAT
jgi:hypothetical protein